MEFTCKIDGLHLSPNFYSPLYYFPQARVFGSLTFLTKFCLRTHTSRCFPIAMIIIVVFEMWAYSLTPKAFCSPQMFLQFRFARNVLRTFWRLASWMWWILKFFHSVPEKFIVHQSTFIFAQRGVLSFLCSDYMTFCYLSTSSTMHPTADSYHAYENLQNFKRLLIEFNR